jgi:hypothetical protein
VMGIGLLGILGGVTIGPEVGKILFGDSFHLDRVDLGLLFAGSAAFILALTLAQALIALQGHGRALVAWVVGLVGVIVGIAATAGSEFLNRVEVGFLVGCFAAAVTMAVLLLTRLRTATPESLSRLVEQIEHEPLEI